MSLADMALLLPRDGTGWARRYCRIALRLCDDYITGGDVGTLVLGLIPETGTDSSS